MLQQTTSLVLVARTSHMSSPAQKKIWRKSSSMFCRADSWSNGLQLSVHLMKVAFQRKLTIYPVHLSALLTVCLYCICYLSLLRTHSPQHQGFLLVFIIVMHLKLATSASALNGWSGSMREKKMTSSVNFLPKKQIAWENTKQNPD